MPAILNADFDFRTDASRQERDAFVDGQAGRIHLKNETLLWKWTDYPPDRAPRWSPWWLPLQANVPPFEQAFWPLQEIERQAKQRGGGPRFVFRGGVAVLPEWNDMLRFAVIRLRADAYAFAGPAASQQMTDDGNQPTQIYLAGGLWQLFVPNLSADTATVCDAAEELTRAGLDAPFWLSPARPADGHVLSPKTKRLLRLLGLPDD